jgi:thiol-disulfide isomerase/thioredoxin
MNPKTKNIILGVVVVLVVASIAYIEYTKPPGISQSQIKSIAAAPSSLGSASSTASSTASVALLQQIEATDQSEGYQPAVELVDPTGFINTAPFKLSDLVGKKVILLDFWTYSCINCIRTLPYLNAWYQKYKDYGLVIVGIHTPEFDFEKDYSNVSNAVNTYGVQYPVVLDSNYGTWDAYQNNYWPCEYLIDIGGYVVHNQIGEGDYATTEAAIQAALKNRAAVYGLPDDIPTGTVSPSNAVSMDVSKVTSEETYFGSQRNGFLTNGVQDKNGIQQLSIPATIRPDSLYLGGTWNFENQFAENTSTSGAKIVFEYGAKNLYFVASSDKGVTIKVLRDGQPLGSSSGADVSATSSTAFIKSQRLYNLIQGSDYGQHTIEIDIEGAGLDAYTFTFG